MNSAKRFQQMHYENFANLCWLRKMWIKMYLWLFLFLLLTCGLWHISSLLVLLRTKARRRCEKEGEGATLGVFGVQMISGDNDFLSSSVFSDFISILTDWHFICTHAKMLNEAKRPIFVLYLNSPIASCPLINHCPSLSN